MLAFILALIIPFTATSFEMRTVTPSPVLGYREISFFDENQQRNREIMVWYPIQPQTNGIPSTNPWDVFKIASNAPLENENKKYPVIIISHGYTGTPHQLSWLIRGLVYNGYIVLGIQHVDLIDNRAHANHWQRAQDISLIIDQFTSNTFSTHADLSKIGIAGYSLGGTTAIWVAGGRSTRLETLIPGSEFAAIQDYIRANEALATLNKQMMAKDWRESRIKAVFVMAPAWAWLFEEESLAGITIPTYIIASSADRVLVTKNNAGFFARNIPKAIYQEIPGKVDHYIFISSLNENQSRQANPTGRLNFLFDDDGTIDRNWIQFQVISEAVSFFNYSL